MSTAVAPLVRQVVERARTEPGFAEVLDAILGAPTTPQGTLERVAARTLNDERRSALVREFVEGALATPKVQQRLALQSAMAKLTVGGTTFRSETTVTFSCVEPGVASYLDLTAESVREVTLNGVSLAPDEVFDGNRIALPTLAQLDTAAGVRS